MPSSPRSRVVTRRCAEKIRFEELVKALRQSPDDPASFKYPPLLPSSDNLSIRLVRISRLKYLGSYLVCHLESFRLDSCPKFQALSYTWGSPFGPHHPRSKPSSTQLDDWDTPSQPITCNGNPILIRKNLHDAFNAIFDSEEKGWLWCDLLCINQQDIVERRKQISLMSEIYRKASTVICWLGRSTAQSQEFYLLYNSLAKILHHDGIGQDQIDILPVDDPVLGYELQLILGRDFVHKNELLVRTMNLAIWN